MKNLFSETNHIVFIIKRKIKFAQKSCPKTPSFVPIQISFTSRISMKVSRIIGKITLVYTLCTLLRRSSDSQFSAGCARDLTYLKAETQ